MGSSPSPLQVAAQLAAFLHLPTLRCQAQVLPDEPVPVLQQIPKETEDPPQGFDRSPPCRSQGGSRCRKVRYFEPDLVRARRQDCVRSLQLLHQFLHVPEARRNHPQKAHPFLLLVSPRLFPEVQHCVLRSGECVAVVVGSALLPERQGLARAGFACAQPQPPDLNKCSGQRTGRQISSSSAASGSMHYFGTSPLDRKSVV